MSGVWGSVFIIMSFEVCINIIGIYVVGFIEVLSKMGVVVIEVIEN